MQMPLAQAGKAMNRMMTRKPGDRLRETLLMGAKPAGCTAGADCAKRNTALRPSGLVV